MDKKTRTEQLKGRLIEAVENSREFQQDAHTFVANLFKRLDNYRPVKELQRGESYPPHGRFLSGPDILTRPMFTVSAAPKGNDKILVMFSIDVESSNEIHRGNERMKAKAIEFAKHLIEKMTELGGDVRTRFERSVSFDVVFPYSKPKQSTSSSSGRFYDPYVEFKNRPGELARSARMGRVGAEFRGSYGGDASNYRESFSGYDNDEGDVDLEYMLDEQIEFHKQGQAAAQYKGSVNEMHAAKIRELEVKKKALKQSVLEGVDDMKLLRELLNEAEKKKKVGKKTAASVYHRDYLKTKNKPYRQYDPDDRKKSD